LSATIPGSGVAPARARSTWLAPALATLLISLLTLAVWEFRIVADASKYTLMSSDPMLYYFPMLETAFSELRAGRLFLWNPYQLGGSPGIATGVAGFLYPPNLLHLFLPTALAIEVLTVVHLILAALFTLLAARSFGISWPGAIIAGLAYSLTFPLGSIYYPNAVAALCWFPLGIAAIERVVVGDDRRWLPVLSISAAMPWLSAAPQTATYIWCAFGISASCAMVRLGLGTRPVAGTAVRLIVAMAAAALLAGPQVLPTIELTMTSARGEEPLGLAQYTKWNRQAGTSALSTAVVPTAELRKDFVGAISIAVACAAFWARGGGLQVFCLLLILWGSAALLAPDWYLRVMHSLPVVGSYRIPARAFFCASLAVALLAGLGVDAIVGKRTSERRRMAAIVTSSIVGLALALFRYPGTGWWVPVALPAVGVLAVWSTGPTRVWSVSAALLVLLLTDLFGFTRNTSLLPYVNDAWRQTNGRMELFSVVRDRAGLYRIVLGSTSVFFPTWSHKTAMLAKFYTVEDHEPLALGQYADYFETAAGDHRERGAVWMGELPAAYLIAMTPEMRRFLNLLSVRYILAVDLWLLDPSFQKTARSLTPVKRDSELLKRELAKLLMYEDPKALPRAYAVYHAECFDRFDEQLTRLREADFAPNESVVLDGGCEEETGSTRLPPVVSTTSYEASRVELSASADQPAWLVLTDTFYPGWQAFVNGRREPIRRANGVVRAVRIPAGESRIEFRYVPWSLYSGMIGAGLVVPLWAGWLLLRGRRRDSGGTPVGARSAAR